MTKYLKTVLLAALLITSNLAVADLRKNLADDYAHAVNAGFAYILSLQDEINSGTLDAGKISNATLTKELKDRFRAASGSAYDSMSSPFANHRELFIQKYLEVVNENKDFILAGGQDAFVPAFFRAELLHKMNDVLVPRGILAVATMRDSELINADRSIEILMRGMPTQEVARELLEKGDMETHDQVVQGHYMHYRPMKLSEGCVACHARNGLVQQLDAFGGALIINVSSLTE